MKFTPVYKENTVSVYTYLGGVKSFLGGLNSPRGDFTPVLRTGVKFFLRIFFANFCRFLHVYTISFFTPG